MLRAFIIGAVVAFAAASCGGVCEKVCDGCCTDFGVCVPLAQTTRTQCGHGGAACVNGDVDYCPVCDKGVCSTGIECWGGPPASCECGYYGPPVCGRFCGDCAQDATCVNSRCVPNDAGTDDAGAGDGGIDDGGTDGG